MEPHEDRDELPQEFVSAVASARAARLRSEVTLDDTPAPQRLAPHAIAFTADVVVDDEDVATGRLVLLHDPAGHDTWEGRFRVVTFARVDVEPDLAADPLVTRVAWSWLMEALEARGAAYGAAAGTVTRTSSESFGSMADKEPDAQLEIRASWTPRNHELAAHLEGWTEMLCTAAGLPPLPPGVVAMPTGRNRRH